MNTPQNGLRVAGTIFGLVSLGHLLRMLLRFQFLIGSHHVPMWMNALAFLVTAALAWWLWQLSLPAKVAPAAKEAPPPAAANPA
ncbi:MAG TPA: hypothetical protein VG936_17800 [Lacunisphaera sp.]|nr:hypothetical protein [Lacunisphaera sp.]